MASTLGSVTQALRVLRLLRVRGAMRLSDVARELDVGNSTAHRLLATLRAEGFVQQEADGRRYALGPAMLATTGVSAIEHGAETARPVLHRLREETGETVHLSALKRSSSYFVASAESSRMIRVTNRVGQHPSAHTTAAGKVLLAALPTGRVLELFPDEELPAATDRSIRRRADLVAELDVVRRQGYARNLGESEPDMYTMAVPIVRPGGDVLLSLSLAAPLSRVSAGSGRRLTEPERGYLLALRGAAESIEEQLSF